jgi:voltage-gated potassium channel
MGHMSSVPESSSRQSAARDHAYKVALALAIAQLALGTIFYHFVEEWTWVDSFYFSSVAITTVGFGDLSPSTEVSKLLTVLCIVGGLSLMVAVLYETLWGRVVSHAAPQRNDSGFRTGSFLRGSHPASLIPAGSA